MPALLYSNMAEPAKKKNKIKNFEDVGRSRVNKSQLLTSITPMSQRRKKKRDINEITYFNYNKKSYYVSNYTKPKNYYQSQQFPYR